MWRIKVLLIGLQFAIRGGWLMIFNKLGNLSAKRFEHWCDNLSYMDRFTLNYYYGIKVK